MKATIGHRGRIVLLALVGGLAVLGFVALAASLDSGSIADLDRRAEQWAVADAPAWLEWIARVLTRLGGVVGVVIVVALALLWLLRSGRRADAVLLLLVTIGVQVLVALLKNRYERPRPDTGSPIALPDSYSFPSGHAATGIAVGAALGVLAAERLRSPARRAVTVALAVLVGLAIGASRVVLNVHFLSDVLAGYCVGLAWLCVCLIGRELLARPAA